VGLKQKDNFLYYQVFKRKPSQQLLIEVPVPSQESKWSCICVLEVSNLLLPTILILDFRIITTVWILILDFRIITTVWLFFSFFILFYLCHLYEG
jgi:hypothetical protein